MSKNKIKFYYKDLPNNVVLKSDINAFDNYDSLKDKIYEKSKANLFKNVKVSEGDKFILEIEDSNLDGLSQIWDSTTFQYFKEKFNQNPSDKMKIAIVKVNEYPTIKRPEYEDKLKNALEKGWNLTKKEIEDELTEKYLGDGKRFFIQEKKEKDENLKEQLYSDLHANIICNNCLSSNFSGVRYICCECDNFNLCEYCQENARVAHKQEHTFIKLNRPVLVDIQMFDSIFSPNKKLITQKQIEPFEISVEIMNNGEKDLQRCFISPIRFGKNYLGCVKKTIIDECKRGEKIKLDVLIKFEEEDDDDYPIDNYEGYFRLMTEEGIPFGDIFYLQVIVEEE